MPNPPQLPETESLLPTNLGEQVAETTPNEIDQITDLQGQLASTEDALNDAQNQVTRLEADNKRLKENFPIKQTAIKFARRYLIIIPVACMLILILSANNGFNITLKDYSFQWNWKFSLGKYTQSALVIGPIAFVATVLGFMIRGVFGQQSNSGQSIPPCLLYTSPSPRDRTRSRMPSSA